MSQKNIASVLLMIASALGGPVAVEHALDVQEKVVSSVEIDGPENAEVGELVQLTVSGDRPSWLTPVDDVYINGSLCILSFREPGQYEVVASSVAGRSTRVVRHRVTVAGRPEPAPEPAPEPKIDEKPPQPSPHVPEPAIDTTPDLTIKVAEWCREADVRPRIAKQLGDNFIDAASRSDSIDELLQRVAKANRRVDQSRANKVLLKVQNYLYENLSGEGFVEHQCAFSDIGQGFLQYSTTGAGRAR